jgi:hypothetical protein
MMHASYSACKNLPLSPMIGGEGCAGLSAKRFSRGWVRGMSIVPSLAFAPLTRFAEWLADASHGEPPSPTRGEGKREAPDKVTGVAA